MEIEAANLIKMDGEKRRGKISGGRAGRRDGRWGVARGSDSGGTRGNSREEGARGTDRRALNASDRGRVDCGGDGAVLKDEPLVRGVASDAAACGEMLVVRAARLARDDREVENLVTVHSSAKGPTGGGKTVG